MEQLVHSMRQAFICLRPVVLARTEQRVVEVVEAEVEAGRPTDTITLFVLAVLPMRAAAEAAEVAEAVAVPGGLADMVAAAALRWSS
jgi:hypothetical protein